MWWSQAEDAKLEQTVEDFWKYKVKNMDDAILYICCASQLQLQEVQLTSVSSCCDMNPKPSVHVGHTSQGCS